MFTYYYQILRDEFERNPKKKKYDNYFTAEEKEKHQRQYVDWIFDHECNIYFFDWFKYKDKLTQNQIMTLKKKKWQTLVSVVLMNLNILVHHQYIL